VLTLTNATKQRTPVQGLGQRAFFTVVYPDDKYRRAGLLAVFTGPRIVTMNMDAHGDNSPEETLPAARAPGEVGPAAAQVSLVTLSAAKGAMFDMIAFPSCARGQGDKR
jgi:hypothetical protein